VKANPPRSEEPGRQPAFRATKRSPLRNFLARFNSTPEPEAAAVVAPAAFTEAVPSNGKKILIVDDDPIIHATTCLKLKSHGYTVISAADGAAAIRAVREDKPDLILLDVSLPADMGAVAWDGFLIMSWLQRLEEARNIPVFVITGGELARHKERLLAAGARVFFNKPIEHEILILAVKKAIDEKQSG